MIQSAVGISAQKRGNPGAQMSPPPDNAMELITMKCGICPLIQIFTISTFDCLRFLLKSTETSLQVLNKKNYYTGIHSLSWNNAIIRSCLQFSHIEVLGKCDNR